MSRDYKRKGLSGGGVVAINLTRKRMKKAAAVPGIAHLPAQDSRCGTYALINAGDAAGTPACKKCGLYHVVTP